MFKKIQIEGATTAFFNARIRGEFPDGYSFYIGSDDCHVVLMDATIDFVALDEGPHVTGSSAVGTFKIEFYDADDIALNILQALEYHDMLDQVTKLETELMFPAS
tara:strand:- start:4403 stop:4717 length:315 start_codon:yes stop_codon:yes gene_type:complete